MCVWGGGIVEYQQPMKDIFPFQCFQKFPLFGAVASEDRLKLWEMVTGPWEMVTGPWEMVTDWSVGDGH